MRNHPVIFRDEHTKRSASLSASFDYLDALLKPRALRSPNEGSKDGTSWPQPDKMAATIGTEDEIRVAVGKLKAELAEIAKIKTVTITKADKLQPAAAAQAKPAAKSEPEIYRFGPH